MPTSHLQWWKLSQKYGHGNVELTEEESHSVSTSSSFWNVRSGLPWHLYIIHSLFECHTGAITANININIVLLEPAQAAKEYSVGVGRILTHQLVNSRAWLQSQSQRLCCAGHCSLADSLQSWPCSSSALSPSPEWTHILPVTCPSLSVSRSAAGQPRDSTPSVSPSLLYDPAASLHWRVVKKPEKARGFSVLLITVYKSSVNGVHPLPSKQCLNE